MSFIFNNFLTPIATPTISFKFNPSQQAPTTTPSPSLGLQAKTELVDTSKTIISTEVSAGIEQAVAQSYVDRDEALDPMSFPHPPVKAGAPVPPTLDNFKHLLERYGVTARYDVIKKKIRLGVPGLEVTVDNEDNVTVTHIIHLANLNKMSTGQVYNYIEAIADQNRYCPPLTWIATKPWDGKNRLQDICETLEFAEGFDPALGNVLTSKWLLSSVAALVKDGFHSRGVLTLQGPQGIGKTSWIRALIPDPVLRAMVIKVDHQLDALNKDSVIGAMSHWIVEIGELESSFRKDFGRLKGLITADKDKIRRPYARGESEYQRRTVFIATVNDSQFLKDSTGNTRFWTLPVVSINYQHGIDMQQLFAQLLVEVQKGATWWLTKEEEEMLEAYNSQHRATSAIRELILEDVVPADDRRPVPEYLPAIKLLKRLGVERPTNGQCKEAANTLRELYGQPKKVKGNLQWRVYFDQSSDVCRLG